MLQDKTLNIIFWYSPNVCFYKEESLNIIFERIITLGILNYKTRDSENNKAYEARSYILKCNNNILPGGKYKSKRKSVSCLQK